MINLTPLVRAKLQILAHAARARQQVILQVRYPDTAAVQERLFNPYHKVKTKLGNITYLGIDPIKNEYRQFKIGNIVDIQLSKAVVPTTGKAGRFVKNV